MARPNWDAAEKLDVSVQNAAVVHVFEAVDYPKLVVSSSQEDTTRCKAVHGTRSRSTAVQGCQWKTAQAAWT